MLLHPHLMMFFSKSQVAKAICLFLSILVFWVFIDEGLFLSSFFHQNSIKTNLTPVQQSNLSNKEPHLNLSYALFGSNKNNDLDEKKIVKSTLALTIVGILYSPNDAEAQVIIRTEAGIEKVYQIGDALPDGPIIDKIFADKIIINQKDHLESLELPKPQLDFQGPIPDMEISE